MIRCWFLINIDIKLLYNKDYICNRISEIVYCCVLKFNIYMCIIVKKNFIKKIFDMFYGMVFWFYKVNLNL